MKMNSFDRAELMYKILQKKGRVTLDDIIFQFRVSVSTARNILRIMRILCERDENCEVVEEGRGYYLVYNTDNTQAQASPAGQQEETKQQRSIDEVSPEELFQAKAVKMLPDAADRRGTAIVRTEGDQ